MEFSSEWHSNYSKYFELRFFIGTYLNTSIIPTDNKIKQMKSDRNRKTVMEIALKWKKEMSMTRNGIDRNIFWSVIIKFIIKKKPKSMIRKTTRRFYLIQLNRKLFPSTESCFVIEWAIAGNLFRVQKESKHVIIKWKMLDVLRY